MSGIQENTAAESGLEVAPAPNALSPEQVADYLLRNPDFFIRNTEVLVAMQAPKRWSGDGVIDMQKVLLDRQQGAIDDLRACAEQVIETSRGNMSVQTRTHAAVLALLAVNSIDRLAQVVTDDLPLLLDVDMVTLGFERDQPTAVPINAMYIRPLAAGTVDRVLGFDRNVLLVRDMTDDGTVFDAAAGLIRSAAMARLRPSRSMPMGLLALGSRGTIFHPGQGTELLGFLARVVEGCIHRVWDGRR
ncbi:MAG: DUF484 family protein [Rhodospirillales bacterium]|nr:DUF484 family protein [Rhodospirillales bacterium]